MRVLYTWLRREFETAFWTFQIWPRDAILSLTADWGWEGRPVGQFTKLPETKHLSSVTVKDFESSAQQKRSKKCETYVCETKCTCWSNSGISNPLIRLFALDCTLCIATAYLEQQSTKVGIKVNPGKHRFLWKLHFWPIFDKSAQLTTVISKSRQ